MKTNNQPLQLFQINFMGEITPHVKLKEECVLTSFVGTRKQCHRIRQKPNEFNQINKFLDAIFKTNLSGRNIISDRKQMLSTEF